MTTETSTRQMSFTIQEDGIIRADFGTGLDPLTLNPQEVPEDVYPQIFSAGLIAFLRARSSKLSGEDRTPAALREVTKAGIIDLLAGKLHTPRVSSAAASFTANAEAAHVYRVLRFAETNPGETYAGTLAADAAAFVALDEDKQKKLLTVPRFQQALAQVKAARLAAKAAKLAKKADASDGEDGDF
jgi:hypothetical protein